MWARGNLESMSGPLKKWFADCIGDEYAKDSAELDEDAKIIQGWLAGDPKLCFMVMEKMHERLKAFYYEDPW